MNLQVPPELEAKLARLAESTGRTVDQVVLDLLASSVDHDEWFTARPNTVALRPTNIPPPLVALAASMAREIAFLRSRS